jgi:hypothetical protein
MNADLETDLIKTDWIVYKCKHNQAYAQNLYAALCNNRFYKNDEEWTCSWRYAGSVVSNLIGQGCYLDYYCSGISACNNNFVSEGEVTSEISNDLLNLGWIIKSYEL